MQLMRVPGERALSALPPGRHDMHDKLIGALHACAGDTTATAEHAETVNGTAVSPAQRYLHHRSEADKANGGAASVGHRALAHAALREFAESRRLSTDDAAAAIRREFRS